MIVFNQNHIKADKKDIADLFFKGKKIKRKEDVAKLNMGFFQFIKFALKKEQNFKEFMRKIKEKNQKNGDNENTYLPNDFNLVMDYFINKEKERHSINKLKKAINILDNEIKLNEQEVNINFNKMSENKKKTRTLSKSFNKMSEELKNRDEELLDLVNSKQTFIDNLSHEINTPLTTILGYTELLERAECTEEQRIRFLDNIKPSHLFYF